MPPFDGATGWLNTEPSGPPGLDGRVVLVNFWTWTCINWLRQVPYVRAWADAYRDDGLVVVGVHTPEFTFEHDAGGVARAVGVRGIGYPVAIDDDYRVWRAFANHYWPALYFVDRDGVIRDQHFGEGRYERSERVIQDLLGVDRPLVDVEGAGVEAPADWEHLRSPETYLGSLRGERRADTPPARLRLNGWTLTGSWTPRAEHVALREAGGSIAIRFHARDAHLVMAGDGDGPIPFRVRLDGEEPGDAHGVDVDGDGRGELRDSRMYGLVRQPGRVRDRTLEIAFEAPGAEGYAFTFG
jgi:hypothetical protein